MGFLSRLFGKRTQQEAQVSGSVGSESGLTAIGLTEPFCPHCGVELAKMPGRKAACKSCGEAIHVRTRPLDDTKVLLRPDQLDDLEEQWAIRNGTLQQLRENRVELEELREATRQKLGREPSDNDVLWALYNRHALAAASRFQWGLYRNAQFSMAELLAKEKRYEAVADLLSIVMYFDVCGARNAGTYNDKPLSGPESSWNTETAFFAPGITNRFLKAIEIGKLDELAVHKIFLRSADSHYRNGFGMPLTPEQAWKEVRVELGFA